MANDFFTNCIDNNKLYTEGKTLMNIILDPDEEVTVNDV